MIKNKKRLKLIFIIMFILLIAALLYVFFSKKIINIRTDILSDTKNFNASKKMDFKENYIKINYDKNIFDDNIQIKYELQNNINNCKLLIISSVGNNQYELLNKSGEINFNKITER